MLLFKQSIFYIVDMADYLHVPESQKKEVVSEAVSKILRKASEVRFNFPTPTVIIKASTEPEISSTSSEDELKYFLEEAVKFNNSQDLFYFICETYELESDLEATQFITALVGYFNSIIPHLDNSSRILCLNLVDLLQEQELIETSQIEM